jgi:hypothetical protein
LKEVNVKRKLSIVLAVILTLTLLSTSLIFAYDSNKTTEPCGWWCAKIYNWLEMNYYCGSGEDGCWCGPSSGVSIGRFYRAERGYSNLPKLEICDEHGFESNWCYEPMYDALHEYMDTAPTGYTSPSNYGPGFVEMALHYEYDNFSYVHYGPDSEEGPVDEDFFMDVIVEAIDNGWPVALFAMGPLDGFEGVEALPGSDANDNWPATNWHVIAIEGYQYYWYYWQILDRRIRCTDNYSNANTLWLSWDDFIAEVPEHHREAVIIKNVGSSENDGYVENFEWGSDGDDLDTSGGEVKWATTTGGSSATEIDDDVYHGESGRSARLYRSGSGGSVYAYYRLFQPSYISFWVRKSDTANAEFTNGDGSNRIWVRINPEEELQYYDGTEWNTVCDNLETDTWYPIMFTNIDWSNKCYDIWFNGSLLEIQADMYPGSTRNGYLYFTSLYGSGTFWIDDIKDSLVQP